MTDLRPRRPGAPLPQSPVARRPRTRLARLLAPLGPTGRIAVTALALAPLWWFATTDTIGVVGLPVWVLFVLPKALRDIWAGGGGRAGRSYRLGRRGAALPGDGDSDGIGSRAGPTRW